MFGFNVRTRHSGPASPRSVGSPVSNGSPAVMESPKGTNSPRTETGEIDTSAPFQSVKAAVSLFKDVGSPKAVPVNKKSKADERVLEKETQHHMMLRELDYYKDQMRNAEIAKAQALRELQRANRTLVDLTNKLETLSESKQAAIKSTEAAKSRASQLEKQKSMRAQLGSDAWKIDVDNERELYKASAGELIAAKQELTNLRQDFDAAIEGKLAAFQQAEDAQHVTKVNKERQSQLSNEVASLTETLEQVKAASSQAIEEHARIMEEKEALLQNHKTCKEEVEAKMKQLMEEYEPEEVLEEKLEATTDAIRVMREQLNAVRESDLSSLATVASELDDAKRALQEVIAEEKVIQSSVESLKLELEGMKRQRSESEQRAFETESAVEQMQSDIEKLKTEKAILEAEDMRRDAELFKQEAEAARIAAKEAEEKLEIALKEVEAAKLAEKLADDQIHNSPRTDADNSQGSVSIRKIKLSVDEFESMKKKIEDLTNKADVNVATAMAQVEIMNANERQVAMKVDEILKEMADIQSETEDALKRAEMAEAAKKVVEGELLKWRREERSEAGESSYASEATRS
ncbi:WEB family protein-like [Dorcoceras hygrometricum]|uniref:WEB family protein-like n=1 Tax=Dorcoceras hygrometricum TaxID=472368 RepID=A0A2Z7B022_9LAMI|nr:WEB family protein-like [Dorcoceras hygrometricum]